MIGLDTNILVRYVVRDDPVQTEAATSLVETHCTLDDPGFVSLVVLAELSWVLVRAYKYPKQLVVAVLSKLLSVAELAIEESTVARVALRAYQTGNADFADYLIGGIHQSKGCITTMTFDHRASRSAWHTLVE